MAGKSAIPLILVAGGAALLLSGKKKKVAEAQKLKDATYIEISSDPTGDERLQFDAECGSIINKLNFEAHNNWLTNRYYQLLAEGIDDMDQITIQLLKDQTDHCPWDDPTKWTALMKGIHGQLLEAVKAWHAQTGGKGLPA